MVRDVDDTHPMFFCDFLEINSYGTNFTAEQFTLVNSIVPSKSLKYSDGCLKCHREFQNGSCLNVITLA